MEENIPIIKNNKKLTPYKFYTDFLVDLAKAYSKRGIKVSFKLFENGDDNFHDANYRIDPITIPLLLSLFEQLSKFHKHRIRLFLYNNSATIEVLEFLNRSDFFYLSGDNENPTYPSGRKVLTFDESFLGSFKGKIQRKEHRVRAYSLDDDNLAELLKNYKSEELQRDFLISHFTYKVRDHFEELLLDNTSTSYLQNIYIDILSELITNGVLHSKSNAYALMFVDRFKTKFSISDNGVGLEASMHVKQPTFFYKPNDLKNNLARLSGLNNLSERIINNLYVIFEALYYSSLKERRGLFDLMINVVLKSKGYFRLHTENCQIIISNSLMDELTALEIHRKEIYDTHNKYLLKVIDNHIYHELMLEKSISMKNSFIQLFKKAVEKYNKDIKYSSLRFFQVKFRGVHIEVEIPNA